MEKNKENDRNILLKELNDNVKVLEANPKLIEDMDKELEDGKKQLDNMVKAEGLSSEMCQIKLDTDNFQPLNPTWVWEKDEKFHELIRQQIVLELENRQLSIANFNKQRNNLEMGIAQKLEEIEKQNKMIEKRNPQIIKKLQSFGIKNPILEAKNRYSDKE